VNAGDGIGAEFEFCLFFWRLISDLQKCQVQVVLSLKSALNRLSGLKID
jgi:hypothetical protein